MPVGRPAAEVTGRHCRRDQKLMRAYLSTSVWRAAALGTCALLATPSDASPPQTIHLSVGTPLPGAGAVRGTRRYVRYRVDKDGARHLVDIWQRSAALASNDADTRNELHITQRWDGVDGRTLVQDSWFDPGTLAPMSHVRRETKDGKTTVRGFRFTGTSVEGITGLPDNDQVAFRLALTEPVFNFEYDMELLGALPLAAGVTFDIPFYDAGVDRAPGRYPFVVSGTERIFGWDGRPIDCWLITADYNTGHILNRIWVSKSGHVVVREESPLKDGGMLVKSLLPPE